MPKKQVRKQYILGLSSFYHDSAAALIVNGKVVAAAEEERFTRIKHSFQFPENAARKCLEKAGITINDIDYVSYYEKPLLRFERVLDSVVRSYPFSLPLFIKGIPEWINEKIKVEKYIRSKLGFRGKILFVPHHLSHASASYFASGFENAAIFTVDGIGEYHTTSLWGAEKNEIKLLKHLDFPNSLGLLYSTFTAFLGFKINEDEYKVMGLSAYGKPIYKENILKLLELKEDGSFKLNMKYFSFHHEFKMWNRNFGKLFGKARQPNEKISQIHRNMASSIQSVTEDIYFRILNHLYEIYKTPNLCLGGGVALNALANGKIFDNTPFKKVYSIGPSGDGGSAMGAALYTYYSILNKNEKPKKLSSLSLGTEFNDEEIKKIIQKYKLNYKFFEEKNLVTYTAKLLSGGNIVGWFEGPMEYGPRALGNRSILAAPYPAKMLSKVNIVKKREQFRPFAGIVLEEKAKHFFKLPKFQSEFPFMNFCFQVKKVQLIPAITHKDGTCRVQTINKQNGLIYLLVKEFSKQTKIPVLLNTSFNLKGEPIVENPEQAIKDMLNSKMDYLVIGSFIIKNPKR